VTQFIKLQKCINTLTGHLNKINALAISADGRKLVSTSSDRTLKIWDLTRKECTDTLNIPETHTLALSPDCRTAVTDGEDNTILIWDLPSKRRLHTLEGHMSEIKSIVMSPDGKTILSSSLDKTIKIWDLVSGKCLKTVDSNCISTLSFSKSGTFFAAGGTKAIQIWGQMQQTK